MIENSIEIGIRSVRREIVSCLTARVIKSKLKPIFFMQLDKCVKLYAMLNLPLQEISNNFPVYFVCSGNKEDNYVKLLKKFYPNANFIECEENSNILKNQMFFNAIRTREDYDIVIRTCMDSVIVNIELLLEILENKMTEDLVFIGNPVFDGENLRYIRGGCNSYSKSFVKQAILPTKAKNKHFDINITDAAKASGCNIIQHELFSMGPPINKEYPACHPIKGVHGKSQKFLSIIEEWATNKHEMQTDSGKKVKSMLVNIRNAELFTW